MFSDFSSLNLFIYSTAKTVSMRTPLFLSCSGVPGYCAAKVTSFSLFSVSNVPEEAPVQALLKGVCLTSSSDL